MKSTIPAQEIMVGDLLNGRYRLDAEIGQGGMGVVYRAHDTLLERDVAVKVLAGAGLGTEGRARLLHEARAAARLNHPNIVSVYDAGEAQGNSFIVMELIEDQTLFDRRSVDDGERAEIGIDAISEILAIAQQICAALDHAHTHGVVHRDLKPENVIITANGTAKLTDFGLARSVASRISVEGAIVGTVFYLPPEQALGQELDGRADLYALGAMLYELTTGRLPFTADDPLAVISQHLHAPVIPPRTYNAKIPPALDALIVQLLNKQPEDRPALATHVQQALAEIAQGMQAGTPGDLPPELYVSPLDQLVRGRLVGREQEFAEAKTLWWQAASGAGERNVLLVSGEPGVGKTPLVRELRALAEISGGRTLSGECYAEGSAPYAPIAQVIRQALPLLQDELSDLVMASLITLAPDLQARYPTVPPNPSLDPQAEQQRLFESVVTLCAALTARAPLLLAVEDVQWADGGTLSLLRHLARRGRSMGLKLLIVWTYREVELDRLHPLNEVLLDLNRERLATRIKLTRLDREQTRELLSVMFQEEVGDDFLEGIYRETQGNLFFIEEVCKALIEEGQLYRENGNWRKPDMSRVQLPQSVRLAVQSRVGKLPNPAQDVLRLAAIVGREFDFETLREACKLEEEVLIDALEVAERAQLIGEVPRARGEVFAFAHGLTLTALRESVSGLRRRRLHRRVATTLETLRPNDFEALAYHYREAGDDECAQTYVLRAAERAHQVYANEEAICLYSEALALIPERDPARFDVLAARSQVYDIVARREEQCADVQAMLALAEALDDDPRRCDALIALADFYIETEPFRAREPIQQAVQIAHALGDPVREGHALRRLGFDAWQRHDLTQSREALEGAVVRFQEAGLPGEAATCLHMLSLTLGNQGENAAALEAAEEALALSREAEDRRQEATSLRRLAIVYMNKFEHTQALPFAEQALALHRELGDRSEECNALNVLGIIMGWLGRPEEAQQYLRDSLKLAHDIGSSLGISNAVDNLIWVHFLWQGEYEAGLAFLERQQDELRAGDDAFLVWRLQEPRIRLLTFLGCFEKALELSEAAFARIKETLSPALQARYLSYRGRLYAEVEAYAQAHRCLERAFETAEAAPGEPHDRVPLLVNRAYVALLEGGEANLRLGLAQAQEAIDLMEGRDWKFDLSEAFDTAARLCLALNEIQEAEVETALSYSSEAVRLAERWPFESEGILFTHSRALRLAGREAEADDYLCRAHERMMLVADKTQDPALRQSWLENVRTNRDILAAWKD